MMSDLFTMYRDVANELNAKIRIAQNLLKLEDCNFTQIMGLLKYLIPENINGPGATTKKLLNKM